MLKTTQRACTHAPKSTLHCTTNILIEVLFNMHLKQCLSLHPPLHITQQWLCLAMILYSSSTQNNPEHQKPTSSLHANIPWRGDVTHVAVPKSSQCPTAQPEHQKGRVSKQATSPTQLPTLTVQMSHAITRNSVCCKPMTRCLVHSAVGGLPGHGGPSLPARKPCKTPAESEQTARPRHPTPELTINGLDGTSPKPCMSKVLTAMANDLQQRWQSVVAGSRTTPRTIPRFRRHTGHDSEVDA